MNGKKQIRLRMNANQNQKDIKTINYNVSKERQNIRRTT